MGNIRSEFHKNLLEIKNGELPITTGPKPRKRISKISPKKKAIIAAEKEKRNGDKTELQKWYEFIMEKEEPICWETNQPIKKYNEYFNDNGEQVKEFNEGWHGSIAHILPKADYPSVATHPKNYMILKMWGGTHGQYDSSWLNASKMGVWKYAMDIIENHLFPLLTVKEKSRLPEIITINLIK